MRIITKQFSGLAFATLMLLAVSVQVRGQITAPATPPPPDFSNVKVETTKITANFYALSALPTPPMDATMGVLVTPEGIVLIDSDIPALTPKFMAAIHQISNQPIRFLVNTVMHPAHTGGNELFTKAGVTILGRDELRNRLGHPAPAANGTPVAPPPAGMLPVVTYSGPVTIHLGSEDVQLIPIMARTDGDTMIRLPQEDVIMTGDVFRSRGYAYFDVENGGSFKGVMDALDKAIALAGPNTKIVPSHGAVADRAALIASRDMMTVLRERVVKMIQQGKTAKEVQAANLTADYDAKTVQPGNAGNRLIAAIYDELKAAK